jgi:hypothetical protein
VLRTLAETNRNLAYIGLARKAKSSFAPSACSDPAVGKHRPAAAYSYAWRSQRDRSAERSASHPDQAEPIHRLT